MPLADGDRPVDGDFWFRVLTSGSHCGRGRVSHGAFRGAFLGPASADRPWDMEASGRLRSIAGTPEQVRAHALNHCQTYGGSFNGYMIPDPLQPSPIGLVIRGVTLDVRFTPKKDGSDDAHADLTFTGPIPPEKSEELKKLLLELPDYFVAIHDSVWFTLPETLTHNPAPPPPADAASP